MKSLETMKPLDADGRPIPWMNYPVIDLLRERLTKDLHLFEFGSGFSTTFYAQLVGHVTSIFSIDSADPSPKYNGMRL